MEWGGFELRRRITKFAALVPVSLYPKPTASPCRGNGADINAHSFAERKATMRD